MTWSSTGSAATYPTVTVTKLATGFTGTFVFRVAPDSGIAYLTAAVNIGGSSQTSGMPIVSTPLPAVFRPLTAVTIFPVSGSNMSLVIGTDGRLTLGQTPSTVNQTFYRTFYFTNTTPA